jgi:serine/threonine protein kinase
VKKDPNLRKLSQQTYYGSAPESLWSELAEPEEDPAARLVQETDKHERRRFRELLELTSIDRSRLEIGESIAEGGQAHVSLAKYSLWPGAKKKDVVVKRYKGRLGVRAVHEMRRRIEDVKRHSHIGALCRLIGLLEDNSTGEVSVVMDAYRGDLRNLIDKRMDYLKFRMMMPFHYHWTLDIMQWIARGMEALCGTRMRSNVQDDDATQMMMMPFPYHSTLDIMHRIALAMEALCGMGIIHRDLKASNILVTPVGDTIDGTIRIKSRNVKLKEDLSCDWFYVYLGDYESSDGVVGTGFWRPPEVLKALKEDIRPTYTTAADVYGFGMVCYELLTGHTPFQCEGVRMSDYDAVLSGRRPKLPDYLSPGMTQLLLECWHQDPCQRPTWHTILETLRTEPGFPSGIMRGQRLLQEAITLSLGFGW